MLSVQKNTSIFLLVALVACIILFSNAFAFRAVWYVDGGVSNSGNGTSWSRAFKTIQEAINAASANDEIWVKMGTYALSSTINVNKPVAIYGGFTGREIRKSQRDWQTNSTVVDGQEQIRCFLVTADAVIDGLTITRGYGEMEGGGILNMNCNPTISNCIFSENQAEWGGGILSLDSSPKIINSTFLKNSAWGNGGALGGGADVISGCIFNENIGFSGQGAISGGANVISGCVFNENIGINNEGGAISGFSGVISGCVFNRNRSSWSGGAIFGGATLISDCTFSYNHATDYGGAIDIWSDSSVITNCLFDGNSASDPIGGGAIRNGGSSNTISNCIIRNNSTRAYGGGILNEKGPLTIINSIIYGNSSSSCSGGGIENRGSLTVINSTIYGNESDEPGGGISNGRFHPGDASLIIINSIIRGNVAPDGPDIYNYGTTPTVTYSNIQGGYPGQGNIDADPLFVDSTNGDYHLQRGSPCLDTGTINVVGLPNTDLEGNPRIMGSAPDMGAYEFGKGVSIDIKPGGGPNSINPKSKGKVPVAILSTKDFDASSQVDLNSLTFGRTGDERSLAFCHSAEGVNKDGLQDLLCHFYTQDTGFQCGDTEGILKGETKDGAPIHGGDSVKIVPCK